MQMNLRINTYHDEVYKACASCVSVYEHRNISVGDTVMIAVVSLAAVGLIILSLV